MLAPNSQLDDFPLQLGSGRLTRLSDYFGHWLVLYFYPKDNTPGCTTESIAFSTLYPDFKKAGCEVLGVSRDSVKSHANFRDKHGLTFELVADTDQSLCTAFDVIKEKNMYGKKVLGIERSTFLINANGTLVQAWRGVKVAGHAEAVLAALLKARQVT